MSLTCANVDLKKKTFKVFEKNQRWHELPMSSILLEIFSRRHKSASSIFVFPALTKSCHMTPPTRTVPMTT
ncbi:MAG TPA: hypothetical protein V6C86_02170 [Oculatellaceae cyanobacterium]